MKNSFACEVITTLLLLLTMPTVFTLVVAIEGSGCSFMVCTLNFILHSLLHLAHGTKRELHLLNREGPLLAHLFHTNLSNLHKNFILGYGETTAIILT